MLKIGFGYGLWCTGDRPFDIQNLWTDPRGLTGSELSFFCIAREMRRLGHEVTIFCRSKTRDVQDFDGCKVLDIGDLNFDSTVGMDAFYSWNEPDVLRAVDSSCLTLVNQQLNDFDYCAPGYDDHVDIYTSPSEDHRSYIRGLTPSPHKWEVLANGCEPTQYGGPKVPGRVIYASSPDRGLHLLLQCWPRIKKAVPEAHLKVFYNFAPWFERLKDIARHPDYTMRELAHRAMYIKDSLRRLEGMDIEHCQSVSRTQMATEMSQAEVLAYPCDTVRYTEGFSVTLMEACASGAVPITSSVDSLGGIYGRVVPMVNAPAREHLRQFTGLVIRALTDKPWAESVRADTKAFAEEFAWPKLASKLESLVQSRIVRT